MTDREALRHGVSLHSLLEGGKERNYEIWTPPLPLQGETNGKTWSLSLLLPGDTDPPSFAGDTKRGTIGYGFYPCHCRVTQKGALRHGVCLSLRRVIQKVAVTL